MATKKRATVKKPKQDPQSVVRLNKDQRAILEKLCELEDRSISDVLKLGLKGLCEKHGLEWPRSRV